MYFNFLVKQENIANLNIQNNLDHQRHQTLIIANLEEEENPTTLHDSIFPPNPQLAFSFFTPVFQRL